ncbi:MAG: CXXX repeat peptide maturase [Bacteroides sp.]|nr:CXXX repeat peptide maturase [Bacteroides sp.]
MLKYLTVLLDDNAVSYCHYSPRLEPGESITPELLKKAIFYAMKENLSVQFVYSNADVSDEIAALIGTVDHTDIGLSDADIVVINDWEDVLANNVSRGISYVIRTGIEDLLSNGDSLKSILSVADRVNIVITDVENFSDHNIMEYQAFLDDLIPTIVNEYKVDHQVQLNLLTDRIMLIGMNNCNAGYESITLAPDGKFYVCPAFYLNNEQSIGDIDNGLDIKNPQLYKIEHAPICRICDAFQCKRCVWLNKRMCREINTPSHQQCIMSHVERTSAKKLLDEFRKFDKSFLSEISIPEVDYLDPFEKIIKQK